MSVVGFDIGNESCIIAAVKRGGINVLLYYGSKRETPAVVSFGESQRFFGSEGAAFATINPKSTINQIKRLIGRHYKEPSVQEDLKLLPFVTREGPRVSLDTANRCLFTFHVTCPVIFFRNCKLIMNTLRSLPKKDQYVDSDQRDQPDHMRVDEDKEI